MTAEWSQAGFATIARLVCARTGLAVGPQLRDHIERAARRTMGKLDIEAVETLAQRLPLDAASFDELIDEISVGETYFFRDPAHFDLVRSVVLPGWLVAGARGLRVWSAGCASGEEAYSLAMLLADHDLLQSSFVLATDMSQRALRAARSGRYRDWSFRGLDPAFTGAHLHRERGERLVKEHIRRSVHFAQLNLADDCYPSSANDTLAMQLIFCRNVLMYLQPDVIAGIERRLFATLVPGGYLFLGPSDPMLGTHAPFEVLITPQGGLCYRRPLAEATEFAPRRSQVVEPEAPSFEPPCYEPSPAFELAPARPAEPEPRAQPAHEAQTDAESSAVVAEARAAIERADYARVIELATARPADETLAALHVRAIWNLLGTRPAEALCASILQRHELVAELHYLHALVLLELGRDREASAALRRTLYLDRSLTIAYFTLGSVCARSGELEAARAAYRNAETRCAALPPGEPVVLGDGIHARGLGLAAARALAALGGA